MLVRSCTFTEMMTATTYALQISNKNSSLSYIK